MNEIPSTPCNKIFFERSIIMLYSLDEVIHYIFIGSLVKEELISSFLSKNIVKV